MKTTSFLGFVVLILFTGCGLSQSKIADRERMAREAFIADSIATIEKQRMDSIARVEHENAVKNSIRITSYYTSSPNSAGGVDVNFYYKNLSDKVIKYLIWEGHPINAVEDAVSCTIRGYSTYRGRDTGPVKKGQSGGGHWSCVWYNYQIKKMILTGIEIEYMDGSTLNISGDDLYLIGKKR